MWTASVKHLSPFSAAAVAYEYEDRDLLFTGERESRLASDHIDSSRYYCPAPTISIGDGAQENAIGDETCVLKLATQFRRGRSGVFVPWTTITAQAGASSMK